ncbi:MAG: FecR domain-containing protein [Gemmatimonadaceae bacterium]|jgi:transmembrane sensor|nr:FecR domain-containing protein [Gemmatimonadaceae bacterium]
MHDAETLDPLLVDRWLAGCATAAEQARVTAWRAADPRHAAWLDAIVAAQRPASDATHDAAIAARTDAAWAALVARLPDVAMPIGATTHVAAPDTPPAVARNTNARVAAPRDHARDRALRPRWIMGAGALLAATLAVVVATRALRNGDDDRAVFTAAPGERASTTLPDGSQVTLAPGSRLTWSRAAYNASSRDVALEGEGYFAVVHDAQRPFRVRAGRAEVLDLGTRFAVRATPELREPEVTVEEGSVALTDTLLARRDPGTVLRAGQRGRLTADGAVTVTVARDAGAVPWVRGTLVFDDAPLAEVLPVLSRWYAAPVVADVTLQGRRVSARFERQPLASLVDALALTLQVAVQQRGDTLRLVPLPAR